MTADSDGVAHVTAALEELAQGRAVVVISHNAELARSLSAAKRFRVEDGRVV